MIPVASANKSPSVRGVCLLWLALTPIPVLGGDPDRERTLATVVVSATRRPTLVQDEPLHIEAVPAEEIEENLTVQPGNL
jgi:hypothetical protein